jgi:methyl-accepting chemotaxis protein
MKNWTISKKLYAGIGALVVLTMGLAVEAYMGISAVAEIVDNLADVQAKKLVLGGRINAWAEQMTSEQRGSFLAVMNRDRAALETAKEEFHHAEDSIEKALDEMKPLMQTETGKELLETIRGRSAAWVPLYEEITRLLEEGQIEAAVKIRTEKAIPIAKELDALGDKLVENTTAVMDAEKAEAHADVSADIWLEIGIGVLAMLIAALVFWVVRQINAALKSSVTELAEASDQVASAATQVSSSSQSLAQGASEQAASLEETSASSEEIRSMAFKNGENSRTAAEMVSHSQSKFTETNQALELMVVAMGEINQSSDKIAKIIKVIDDIAFQTNILALNAAVEAARAGEAGMGFAVVADEVRNLAQRCAQAAKDTSSLIEDSISKSNDGKNKVDQVAAAIRAISEESNKIKTLVDEVNLAGQEQARGIDQIGKAITQMEQVTQNSAASAEEGAAAAEQLTAQSDALRDIVGQLTGMVGGGDGAGNHGRRRQQQPQQSRNSSQSSKAPAGFAAGFRHKASVKPISSAQNSRTHSQEPAMAGAKADKNAIPMDGDFEEF